MTTTLRMGLVLALCIYTVILSCCMEETTGAVGARQT
jgi:hypothetical protein